MQLMTKILKPEEFTAETLAAYLLRGMSWPLAPEPVQHVVIDAAQWTLDQMRAQGIIGE
jgi:hypothetical protein